MKGEKNKSFDNEFMKNIMWGKYDKVKEAIRKGVNINHDNELDEIPLKLAIRSWINLSHTKSESEENSFKIIKLLLKAGANANHISNFSSIGAVSQSIDFSSNNSKLAYLLLKYGADLENVEKHCTKKLDEKLAKKYIQLSKEVDDNFITSQLNKVHSFLSDTNNSDKAKKSLQISKTETQTSPNLGRKTEVENNLMSSPQPRRVIAPTSPINFSRTRGATAPNSPRLEKTEFPNSPPKSPLSAKKEVQDDPKAVYRTLSAEVLKLKSAKSQSGEATNKPFPGRS